MLLVLNQINYTSIKDILYTVQGIITKYLKLQLYLVRLRRDTYYILKVKLRFKTTK